MKTADDLAKSIIDGLLPDAETFLCDLISLSSISGSEDRVVDYCARAFANLADDVELVPLDDSIRDEKDYASPIPNIRYKGRHNLRLRLRGCGPGKSLILNAHLDTVPLSKGQENSYDPQSVDGIVYGRGACDDKGQVAVIYVLLSAIKATSTKLDGDLIVHLVVEEENGGNGSLSMVRASSPADGAIVMEPTNLKVVTACRGTLWFRITCHGTAAHSGSAAKTQSALDMAVRVMEVLRSYHTELLAVSRGTPPYDGFENPMPLTLGRLSAGDWPAMVPDRAVLEGVIGFLPNKTKEDIKREMIESLQAGCGDDIMRHVDIEFTLAHDSAVTPVDHPLVVSMLSACERAGVTPESAVLTCGTDSWFYASHLGMPVVVFGCGELALAHSKNEQVRVNDIGLAAHVLFEFVRNWCGEASEIKGGENACSEILRSKRC
ncbi:MAG: M20/M25/M40 family metallo-hydrolase [Armatimonadetes bacterium]|nr:M20/M25/M40 family metallo-hydrolase [Armatimonadota bacterium]